MSIHRSNHDFASWSAKHGLIHQLLPMEHRRDDPIQVLKELHSQFDTWPVTRETWTVNDLELDAIAVRGSKQSGLHLPYFAGCYPISDTRRYLRWTNPAYTHTHNIDIDHPQDRREHIKLCGEVGIFSLATLGEWHNVSKQSVHQWMENERYTWSDLREIGKRRFARTLETIVAWTDYGVTELCRLFPQSRSTIQYWRDQYASDMEVPVEPSLTK